MKRNKDVIKKCPVCKKVICECCPECKKPKKDCTCNNNKHNH